MSRNLSGYRTAMYMYVYTSIYTYMRNSERLIEIFITDGFLSYVLLVQMGLRVRPFVRCKKKERKWEQNLSIIWREIIFISNIFSYYTRMYLPTALARYSAKEPRIQEICGYILPPLRGLRRGGWILGNFRGSDSRGGGGGGGGPRCDYAKK